MTRLARSLYVRDAGRSTAMDASNDGTLDGVKKMVGHMHVGRRDQLTTLPDHHQRSPLLTQSCEGAALQGSST